jgi:UDP-N-acetylglucosamine 2-epimerase (non-hydrolysing)
MPEVLAEVLPRVDSHSVLERQQLSAGGFFLVSCHREENVDPPEQLAALLEMLQWLARAYSLPIVVSTHPRTQKRLVDSHANSRLDLVTWAKPFGYLDYIALQLNARCVLSDSGTLTEEASILGFPAVMLREAHERPEGTDVGAVPFAGLGSTVLPQILATVLAQHGEGGQTTAIADYAPKDVSRTVVRVILSYTDYVNRTVWRRDV